MGIRTDRVTVGQSPIQLSTKDADHVSGAEIIIRPNAPILVGGKGLTVENGFAVEADSEFAVSLRESDVLYALVETGSAEVSVLQAGV